MLFANLSGQSRADFVFIDNYVQATPTSINNDFEALCEYLSKGAKNDLEKVRGIYQWIITGIEYDDEAYKNGNRRINRSYQDILNRKKAICWGYSSLFKTFCDTMGVSCEIVSGYAKSSLLEKPNLEAPNHAWNSVKIDSNWYLIDATWASNLVGKQGDFEKSFGYTYFLTPPQFFIINHLPENPQWQLLDCPISPQAYQATPEQIIQAVENQDCEKKIRFEKESFSSVYHQKLDNAIKAFEYNPTDANKRELGQAHLDYETYLTERAERLQIERKMDSLSIVQRQMINLCEIAEDLTDLYDNQLENCAYNHFNYAITLTQLKSENESHKLRRWKNILSHFEIAKQSLEVLPQNIFTQNALSHCTDYIDYAKDTIESLEGGKR